jgi:transposase
VAPYLTLLPEDARQRKHDLREVFNALGWMVRAGAARRLMPTNFPPWEALCQQTQRRLKAGSFEMMVHDRRALLRLAQGRTPEPWAVVLDGPTLQSTPESGALPATMATSARRAASCPWWWTPWATCWHFW